MPSWNLERSLSQWGLAAGWQGLPLGDRDASVWSARGEEAEVQVGEAGLAEPIAGVAAAARQHRAACQAAQPVALLFAAPT